MGATGLKFNPPNLPAQKSGQEVLADSIGPTISNLPLLYQQLKQAHTQAQMENEKLALLKRQGLSQYGTGAPAPVAEGPANAQGVGPATPPESPTDLMGRIGTEGVKAQADLLTAKQKEETPIYVDPNNSKNFSLTPKQGYSPVDAKTFTAFHTATTPGAVAAYDAQGNFIGFQYAQPGSKVTTVVGKNEPVDKNAQKIAAEKPKAMSAAASTLQEFDNMINEANAIKNDPGLSKATGFVFGRTTLPGEATKVANRLDTLKAKTLLSVLGSLKQLSANGSSGFGQLSEKEGQAIQNSVSALGRTQNTRDFKDSLDRFIAEMNQKKQNIKNAYINTYGGTEADLSQSGTDHPAVGGDFNGSKITKVTPLN